MGQGRRYLFTGGGTGGHVTPNLAIMAEVRRHEPDARFLYAGSRSGYEAEKLAPGTPASTELGIEFRPVACRPFASPRRPLAFLKLLAALLAGTLQALLLQIRYRPHAVVASGGYVSVPVVLAAWLFRRRIYLHEQNAHPGLANRALALFATRIGVSFKESLARFPRGKAVHVGYPVRPAIGRGDAGRARDRFRIAPGSQVAFILGGSMGSRSINRGTVEALKTLLARERLAIIHVTGIMKNGSYRAYEDTRQRLERQGIGERVEGRYVCEPFIDRIEDVYALADLVVARAGAGTVMELATVGKPSILIPKSDSPGDHQLLNAMALERAGSAQVLLEEMGEEDGHPIARVRGDALARKMGALLDRDGELSRMGGRAQGVAVEDALAGNADLVRRLASGDPFVETVVDIDQAGMLIDERGRIHDLLFRSNIVGDGIFADVPVRGNGGRAIIQRLRRKEGTEFHLVPRKGVVEVDGRRAGARTKLRPEDRIRVGGARFTFTTRERQVERQVPASGFGLKVVATTVGTTVSRLFGFLREVITASVFGLGATMDVVAVGLTVSNFFRGVFAEMAVDSAFLPTFIHLHRTGRREEANRLYSSVLTFTVAASALVCVVAMLTLPLWLPAIARFKDAALVDGAIRVTRIMFPYLVLISIAAILSAVLKACDRFGVPAFSSLMFSVGILGGVAAHCWLGAPALEALAGGVLAGGLGQVLFHLPSLRSPELRRSYGIAFRPGFDFRNPGVRKLASIGPNILADSSIQKLGGVVDKVLATPLGVGLVSALYYSMVVFQLPFALISQSLNAVILKELSESQAIHDRESVRRLLVKGVNWSVFVLLPVSVAVLLLAEPLVRLLFERGRFTAADTREVSTALRWYAVGLVGWGIHGLCGRFFAARFEQNRATATSLAALLLNVAFSVALVKAGAGIAGLALGTSLAFLITAALRLGILSRSLAEEGIPLRRSDLGPSALHAVIATAAATVAASVVLLAVRDFQGLPGLLNRLFVVGVPSAFGLFSFVAVAMLLRAEQLDEIYFRFGRRRRSSGEAPAERPLNPYCLPAAALLRWVQKNPAARSHYNFARRTTIFLSSADWKVRNTAIKLIAELRLASFRYDLCAVVACRRPAPRLHRLFGGDFAEPGFLRRNAIDALVKLGVCDGQVEDALLAALDDPYFEARAEAAHALGTFAEQLSAVGREKARGRLGRATKDASFVVAAAAAFALAQVAQDDGVVQDLKALHYHRNWKVRDQVVLAYRRLFERGIVADRGRLLALLDDVLTTCEDFKPRFILKEHMAELQQRLLRPERTVEPPAPPPGARESEAS